MDYVGSSLCDLDRAWGIRSWRGRREHGGRFLDGPENEPLGRLLMSRTMMSSVWISIENEEFGWDSIGIPWLVGSPWRSRFSSLGRIKVGGFQYASVNSGMSVNYGFEVQRMTGIFQSSFFFKLIPVAACSVSL